jgi:hypothetical protein
MEITINTIYGTYIVPSDKTDQLLAWLQQNAVRPGQHPVKEIKEDNYTGRQLINE